MRCYNCTSFIGIKGKKPFCGRCKHNASKILNREYNDLVYSIDSIQKLLETELDRRERHLLWCQADEICGHLIKLRYVKAYWKDRQ